LLPSAAICRIARKEAKQLKKGDLVSAQTFSGKRVKSRVVEMEGDMVCVCNEKEWLSA
jgi:hypothetical protein